MKPWERLLLFSILFSIQGKVGHSETLLADINALLSSLVAMLLAIGAALAAFRSSNNTSVCGQAPAAGTGTQDSFVR